MMMHQPDNMGMEIEEAAERLISRCMDGEAGTEEHAELERLVRERPQIAALLDDCRRIDALAGKALRMDCAGAHAAAAPRRWRGVGGAAAGAIFAAAAVVAVSVVSDLLRPAEMAHRPARPPVADTRMVTDQTAPFVDYRAPSYSPVERRRGLVRDLIGVRGEDGAIYLFERATQTTELVPVSAEF